MTAPGGLHWRLMRRLLFALLAISARRVLNARALIDENGDELRWLKPDIDAYLAAVKQNTEVLRRRARLSDLPSFGNRLMVELAVYTLASDRSLRAMGIAPSSARAAVSDMAWVVYRKMLGMAALPARLTTRDPGQRLQRTIRLLLRFPFDAPGAPGYAVETRVDNGDFLTHFSHCPPQSLARRLSEEDDDPELLENFRRSWCVFDWYGADLIAGDGKRGHYSRHRTLSYGDPVCDMCWKAKASGYPTTGAGGKAGT